MIESQNSGTKSDQFQLVLIYPMTVVTGCIIGVDVNHVVVYTIKLLLIIIILGVSILFFISFLSVCVHVSHVF